MNNEKFIYEDEIDLKELLKTIWKYKIFILIFTVCITLISGIYVTQKVQIPIYQGKIYLEIGQIQDKNFIPTTIENVDDLAYILNLEFGVNTDIPKKTKNLLEITFNNEDKNLINETLIKVKDYVVEKHKKQTEYYENVILTKQIGDINIEYEPINKLKKSLIVSVTCISSLILAIFLVFLFDFIKKIRKEFD